MILLELLIMNLAVILIIDLSGFVPNLKRFISKWLTKQKIETDDFRIRPFDCSYCMTFWILLLYLLFTGQFTLVTLAAVILITHLTDVTRQFMLLLKDSLIKLIDIIYDRLQIK